MGYARPVVFFDIRGDREKLVPFYKALFDWEFDEREGVPASFAKPGIGGPEEGVGGAFLQSEQPGVSIYVQVLDPVATLRQAEQLGGRKIADPFDVPGGPTIATMADPEGNVIGLVKQ
jgi:predicted enzyme related to lactoylglutathione lyase